MSNFLTYNIEEDDIINQYNVDNSEAGNSNQSGINFTIYNLLTIEGVNDLKIQNDIGYGTLLIGYTPITDDIPTSYSLYFLTENDLDYVNALTDPSNPTILRVPDNAKINKIIVKNAKNETITTDNILCIIFTGIPFNSGSLKNIIGNFSPSLPVDFNIFNSPQIGEEIVETIDSSYIFILNVDDSILPNQLEINIYYTIE